ncbi:MAG: TonB-dependent receptor [Dysgonamonadaceae bacterium]|jgi:TonB-linked SusC/RagA family outer membrane protein|nr:TonB-dependent receptor [Dysgonamonadaceae bacterium]
MKKQIIAFFLCLFVAAALFAQNKQVVKGVVKDAGTQEPLIGVSVTLKGTTQGTVTDIDGKYQIELSSPQGATLHFSYISYLPAEIPVQGRSEINVDLTESTKLIEEVVIVGYGKQKKESVIGSISSIGGKDLVNIPVTNITQSLAGRIAGVQIVQPSGEVGKDEAEVYVRGLGTFNNASPIYIVDGIERQSIAQIDPNEIQSINVLKDASATAVYGIKGANGVIVVTTKRGTASKPSVSVSIQGAITQPARIPQPLNSYQTAVLKNVNDYNKAVNDDYTALELLQYRTHASPYMYPDVDWVDLVMKDHSSMQQYNVNVSGGTERVKYFVSGGFLTQNGFYNYDDNTRFSRYNFRSNLDFDVTKNLSMSFNLGSRIEKRTFPGTAWYGSWPVYRAAFAASGRKHPVYNPDGSFAGGGDEYNNIIAKLLNAGTFKSTRSVVEMGLNMRYKLDFITSGLAARGQLAFDNTGENTALWNKSYATYEYNLTNNTYKKNGEDSPLRFDWSEGWESSRQQGLDQNLYMELGLEYERTFGAHSVSGLFLANRNNRTISTFINMANQGLVGRLAYDYDKRYFAEINAGYNGSENFPKGKRYGIFPAFALGWMLSNEAFIQETDLAKFISAFKIRGSIGWVGNDKLPGNVYESAYHDQRFIYLQTYDNLSGIQTGIGDTQLQAIRQGSIANADVSWEVGRKSNIGFDSDFRNGLLGITMDYFYEYRDNILIDASGMTAITPSYVGASFKSANLGVVENSGVEIELSHRKKIGKDFSYFAKGNLSFAKNKVLTRNDPEGMLPYQRQAGYSIGVQNLYQVIGIFQNYDEIYNSPNQMELPGNTEVKPGDLKFLDFNNDGVINEADAFRQGYGTVPEIQYGITLGANYKGFDCNVLFQGSGRSQFNKNWEIMWHFSNNDNVFEKHWYHWSPELSGNEQYVRLYGSYTNNEPQGANGSTYKMGSGNYIRLKSAEIGYTLPQQLIRKIYLSSVRFYVNGNNLFLWADEPYLDPDNRDERGGMMPQTRAINFGVNINF